MTEKKEIHLRNVPHGYPAVLFDHSEFIASIAKWYRPNLFVEYGVENGTATRIIAPHCKRLVGVDINPECNHDIPKFEFYNVSTREFKTLFLDKLKEPIDMAFIDAEHTSGAAFQDFEDLFPHLIESGIIFMHDTYPCAKEYLITGYCGDVWRVPDMIKAKYGRECEILTIPIQPGLTMIRKVTRLPEYMQ